MKVVGERSKVSPKKRGKRGEKYAVKRTHLMAITTKSALGGGAGVWGNHSVGGGGGRKKTKKPTLGVGRADHVP